MEMKVAELNQLSFKNELREEGVWGRNSGCGNKN